MSPVNHRHIISSLVCLMYAIALHAQEPVTPAAAPAQTTTTVTTTNKNGVVTEKRIIVTTAPAPKEEIVTPTGYAYCFTVKAGWYLDVWVAEHTVCQYPNSAEGVVWIEGHWQCKQYDLNEGKCTSWDWRSARWEKTFSVF